MAFIDLNKVPRLVLLNQLDKPMRVFACQVLFGIDVEPGETAPLDTLSSDDIFPYRLNLSLICSDGQLDFWSNQNGLKGSWMRSEALDFQTGHFA